MTGVALASATAIVVATPTITSANITVAAPNPHALSTAQYELTTLETLLSLTLNDWQNAYFFGWGGGVTVDNPWFPYKSG